MNKVFCSVPWVHIATTTSGICRPCCNMVYKPDGKIDFKEHIYDRKLEDIYNNETYITFRKKMLSGEKQDICGRCYREEEVGIKSARMKNNEQWPLDSTKLNSNGTCSIDSIEYIDIRLGNKCNLKCRMCNPWSSNAWVSDINIEETHIPHHELNRLKNITWYDSPMFMENIFSIIDNCKILYISGGEPALLPDQLYKIFDKCIEKNIIQNMRLRFNTNITLLYPKLIDYWKLFKNVTINCSIDGYDKVNEYIRYPSTWNNITKNLKTLIELKKKNYIDYLEIHTTVQIFNIFSLPKLFDYLNQHDIFPYLNILNHPHIYNIKVLNKQQKNKVEILLKDWIYKNKKLITESDKLEKLLQLITYMWEDDWNSLYSDFIKETEYLDSIRNQKMAEYIPELVG